MILVLDNNITQQQADALVKRLEFMGFQTVKLGSDGDLNITLLSGIDENTDIEQFLALPGVIEIKQIDDQFKLAGKATHPGKTVIELNGITIGGHELVVMAGPCSIESEKQIFETAKLVAEAGANILRGGAFKPRTSPYDFQGLGEQGLRYLSAAGKAHKLSTVSEVIATEYVDLVAEHIDILQIGARNMQNFNLLKAVGAIRKPVLLKRGFSATYKDLLMAAEYILSAGNPNVILCERGIRTFETYTRNTLDITAVPALHELSHLPIVVDPSHGTGKRSLVAPMARAAVAAGADGIMVEVHPNPDESLSDAKQTISPETFSKLMSSLTEIKKVTNEDE